MDFPKSPESSPQREPGFVRRIVWGRSPKRTLLRGAILAAFCFGVFRFIVLPIRVAGISMAPTFRDGSVHFVNAWAYTRAAPRRGDVVAISMAGRSVMFLKRIIALPGESVRIQRGKVMINDHPLVEPYVRNPEPWNVDTIHLVADEYFVVGDNRSMPAESHSFGRVPKRKIAGKTIW